MQCNKSSNPPLTMSLKRRLRVPTQTDRLLCTLLPNLKTQTCCQKRNTSGLNPDSNLVRDMLECPSPNGMQMPCGQARLYSFPYSGVYSCTSNGALSLTDVREETLQHTTTALPTRLCNWRLGQNEQTFTYGGDEVELSLWDTERAFSQQKPDPSISQKRKRGTDLLPAEVWRAKNASKITVPGPRIKLTCQIDTKRFTESATAGPCYFFNLPFLTKLIANESLVDRH